MEKLVHVGNIEDFRRIFSSRDNKEFSGIELDLTDIGEGELTIIKNRLEDSQVGVKSIHYRRTGEIPLGEEEKFIERMEMLEDKAKDLECDHLSVSPPKIEGESSKTLKDLQEFIEEVNKHAKNSSVEICFELSGFMKDPNVVNIGFDEINDCEIGINIDLSKVLDGINHLDILDKIDIDIKKVKAPLNLREMEAEMEGLEDIKAVAEDLKV